MDLRGKISFILSILLGYVPRIGVSWYLIALVMSVFIIYYIRSYFGEKVLLTIGIVSFLIGVFTSTYGKWYFDIEWIKQVPFMVLYLFDDFYDLLCDYRLFFSKLCI